MEEIVITIVEDDDCNDNYDFEEITVKEECITMDDSDPNYDPKSQNNGKGKTVTKSSDSSTICSVCGKFVSKMRRSKHMASHEGKKCDICSLVCKSDKELSKHRQLHLENNFTCLECGFYFKTAIDLAIHNYSHYKTFACLKCNFTTQAKSSLIGHIKRHYGEYTHHCSVCGKGFIGKALLASHEEIHLDIKRYACDLCEKKFSVKRYLDVHRTLNHTKELYGFEKLYQCDQCGRDFTFEKSLIRHLRAIHQIGEDRTVECPVCKKVIANNYNLKLHMRIHTGEKRYCCEKCGKAFSAYKYWKKHQITHEKKSSKLISKNIQSKTMKLNKHIL